MQLLGEGIVWPKKAVAFFGNPHSRLLNPATCSSCRITNCCRQEHAGNGTLLSQYCPGRILHLFWGHRRKARLPLPHVCKRVPSD